METSPAPTSWTNLPKDKPWYLPNDTVDGGTVVASVIVVDRERWPEDNSPANGGDWIFEQLLMRLCPFSPYYSIDLYDVSVFPAKLIGNCGRAFNIVEATRLYEENGGDY